MVRSIFRAYDRSQDDRSHVSPLGHTLPSLLEEACRLRPNATAFQQFVGGEWRSLSNHAFQSKAEALAFRLLDLGLERGDRIAFLIQSDVNFAIADMSCALAGLVDVPIDLTQTVENIIFILQHSEAKVLLIANLNIFHQVQPYLDRVSSLQVVLLVEGPLPSLTEELYSVGLLDSITVAPDRGVLLQSNPSDLATLIYVPGEDGQLLGVMLTHENLSGNALAAFGSMSRLLWGVQETALSFLPLTHVFARCLLYGHIYYGHTIYFSDPNHVLKHLKEIKPTIIACVPLLLERIYNKTLEQAEKLPSNHERIIVRLALWLANHSRIKHSPWGIDALLLKIADRFVLSYWRSIFGDRLKYLLSGGAALKPELAKAFVAAGINVLQGYGLTQASAVVCCNRDRDNRAGTVGRVIEGIEVTIAPDHEILVRGAYVTSGYYHNAAATQAAIDEEGWFHTGDLGRFSRDGFLHITGLKKALFKLSTGKYIAPHPIEVQLQESPYVRHAIVVGAQQKFCGALIVPDLDALAALNLDVAIDRLLTHPCIVPLYQSIVAEANCHQPYWASIKRFQFLQIDESMFQTATRSAMLKSLDKEIQQLYNSDRSIQSDANEFDLEQLECPIIVTKPCPTFAQSIRPQISTSLKGGF